MSFTRRQFVTGCSAAIAAMAGGRVGNLFFDTAQAASVGSDEIIVVVFLRGGCDGLSLVSPYDDPTYVAKRNGLALQNALPINVNNASFGATSSFGWHPNAAPLHELYQANKLAVVHACGLNDDTRSHFDAMDYIERGTPGNKNTSSGWLARHMQAITSDDDSVVPSLAAGANAPASQLNDPRTIATNDLGNYDLAGTWRYTSNTNVKFKDAMLKTLDSMYAGSSALESTGKLTISTIRTLRSAEAYTPPATLAYPTDDFGGSLKTVAQMIKLDLGLRVATVDYGGWDHHESEGVNDTWGPFYNQTNTLARGLNAFYNDLEQAGKVGKVTIVVQSEFGRRLGANASNGTDHGHGNMMLVLGGNVNGGKLYGAWPGLAEENLDQRQDLKITTDFRTVLSEIIVRRLGNPHLGTVFPGIDEQIYQASRALGIVRGTDLPLDYTAPVIPTEPTTINGTPRMFLPLLSR